ncbi:MAG: hypothetical protein HYS77_00975 [Candidatus Rokubacteria bacterium]|nr:hypothetical protein [Candidatus Rokubacteria bacterium]MBI4594714.1 hypothetical protein [Candidatus Rokubacteria bacterium]
MTDFLTDTPVVARSYCPGCEPDADPFCEILDVRWCDAHAPVRDGPDDTTAASDAYLSGSAEAGGEVNRRWCELLHGATGPRPRRGKRKLRPA